MDKVTGNKAVIASGANFKGVIKNTPSIEINGAVEADINAEKLAIGEGGRFVGAANVELVVISGYYDGNMNAGSIWATATAEISGKIQYKTIQLDRGAALNCRFIHNWKREKTTSKKTGGSAVRKVDHKKDGTGINSQKKEDEITEVNKKKRNADLLEVAEGAESEPNLVVNPSDEQIENGNGDFKLFADWPKKTPIEDKKLRVGRLGIFKFGSRATKLPDSQG